MLDPGGYLGRIQQGMELPLVLQCTNGSNTPSAPDAAPAVAIYRDGSPPTLVGVWYLGADDRGAATGLFRLPLFLGPLFATAGRYLAVYRYSVASVARTHVESFVLNPGGSEDGAVVSMTYVFRPNARYLIRQTDSGALVRGKNPR